MSASQIWTYTIGVIGLILTILNIVDKMTNMKKNAEAPIKDLQEKVTEHSVLIDEMKRSLDNSHEKHREQNRMNTVFINCMLAFIDFEMAYCSHTGYEYSEDLKKAKKTLQDFLAEK